MCRANSKAKKDWNYSISQTLCLPSLQEDKGDASPLCRWQQNRQSECIIVCLSSGILRQQDIPTSKKVKDYKAANTTASWKQSVGQEFTHRFQVNIRIWTCKEGPMGRVVVNEQEFKLKPRSKAELRHCHCLRTDYEGLFYKTFWAPAVSHYIICNDPTVSLLFKLPFYRVKLDHLRNVRGQPTYILHYV